MLTSVYYYDLYKPYIMGNRDTGTYAPKRGRIADRRESYSGDTSGRVYILNKTLKNEIVEYARNVSSGATGLRSSTRQASEDMEQFNRNIHNDGFEMAQTWLADDLEEFAENYNNAAGFMSTQKHSTDLRTFSYEIADNLYYNRDRLSMLGLSLSDTGRLAFDRSYFNGLTQDEVNVAIGENIQIFADLHRQADSVLNEPLAEHMNFKNLSYHYNYKMGVMVTDDGFGMIESGLLIDRVV